MSVELKVVKGTVLAKGGLYSKDETFTLEDEEVTADIIQLVDLGYLTVESGEMPSSAQADSDLDEDAIVKPLMDYVKSKATQIAFTQKEDGGFVPVAGTAFVGQVRFEDADDAFVPFLAGEVTVEVDAGSVGDVTVDTAQPQELRDGVATFEATIIAGVGVDVQLNLTGPTPSGMGVTDTLTLRRTS